jgi:hypothetical protein
LVLTGEAFFACTTRVEGCLDVGAVNFDLDADRACEECCQFPVLSISLSQKWNDRNFTTEDTLYDIHQVPYMVKDLRYYLSSFSWFDAGGAVYTVDTTVIRCGASALPYTSDIIEIESRRFSYNLDTFHVFPIIDSLRFDVGCLDRFDCVDEGDMLTPAVLSGASPLWDSLSMQRASVRIVLQKDLMSQQLDTVYLRLCHKEHISYNASFQPGKNQVMDITVNYALWFEGFDTAELFSLETSLNAGIPGSFTRTP